MTEKNSFIVYRSFYIGIQALKKQDRLQLYDAIFEFGLNHTEIDLKPLPQAMFELIKPQLEANHRKFLNGKKGGKATQELWAREGQSKEQSEGQKKGKATANVNANVNVNGNVNYNDRVGLPLKSGDDYFLTADLYIEIKKTFPSCDLDGELKKMRVWLLSNPSKRKTHVGTPRFVTNWLSRNTTNSDQKSDTYASIHEAVMQRKNVRK